MNDQERAVDAINGQLAATRAQLESQRGQLSSKQETVAQLASRLSELQSQSDALQGELDRLATARVRLAELSVQINNCLHVLGGALSHSAAIAETGSMRTVAAGLRGVTSALGAETMFAGALAQLNDEGLAVLDRRVSAIKRNRLTV